jgi:hypothetical protein
VIRLEHGPQIVTKSAFSATGTGNLSEEDRLAIRGEHVAIADLQNGVAAHLQS